MNNIKSDINTYVNNPEKAIELLDNVIVKDGVNENDLKNIQEFVQKTEKGKIVVDEFSRSPRK